MKIISVSGVDGAGKSTFIREVREMLQQQAPAASVGTAWLRFNPRASPAASGNSVVSTLDSAHKGHPIKRVARRLGCSSLWVWANTRLYRRQLAWQLASRTDIEILLVDRFTLDFIADNVGSGLLSATRVGSVTSSLPTADVAFVLTVSDADLAVRKDPREDLSGLKRRRDLYLQLAGCLDLPIVDTTTSDWQADVLANLRSSGVL